VNKKRAITTILLALGVILALAVPVLADVAEEPDTLLISQVEVYRDCLEDEDQLYLITGTIDYTDNPSLGADELFIIRLLTSTGVELGSATPYAYFDDGYDYFLVSIYFNAADAPAWEPIPNHIIKLQGNPTHSWLNSEANTAMGGAASYDVDAEPTYTDETTEANSTDASDMNILPPVPAQNDAYYFGSNDLFDILTIDIGIQGTIVASTPVWEYWDGTDWTALIELTDDTAGFTAVVGEHDVTFTIADDWALTTIADLDLYWVRFRETHAAPDWGAIPFGTQSWTNTIVPPSIETDAFTLWFDSGLLDPSTERKLTTRIGASIGIAQTIEDDWGGDTDLIEIITGGNRLTSEGEDYFTNSIDNLRVICPNLFLAVVSMPEFEEREYEQAHQATLADRLLDTIFDMSPLVPKLGLSRMWISTIIWLLVSGVVAVFVVMASGSYRPALLIFVLIMPFGAVMGFMPLIITIAASFIAALGIIYVFFYRSTA